MIYQSKLRTVIGCIALFAVFHVPAYAENADAAGIIISSSGNVTSVNKDGESQALSRRSSFFEGDTIVTSDDAKAKLRFSSGELLSLAPSTQFKIQQYHYDPALKESNTYSVQLLKGSFLSVSGAIVKLNPEGYKVETNVGTIGIFGTEVIVSDLQGKITFTVVHATGKVTMTTPEGQFDVKAGTQFTKSYGDDCQTGEKPTKVPSSASGGCQGAIVTIAVDDVTTLMEEAGLEPFTEEEIQAAIDVALQPVGATNDSAASESILNGELEIIILDSNGIPPFQIGTPPFVLQDPSVSGAVCGAP